MLKSVISVLIIVSIVAGLNLYYFFPQQQEPWTEKQLIQPAELAAIINDAKRTKPIIYNIGPAGNIKGAIAIGNTKDEENLQKLKADLRKRSKEADIVIYCGCCPFKDCPNIRPAFRLLNQEKFKNHKLLNIPKNLKVDWIDKGYPMQD
ncbi:MAG: rhodanese-like domain-containing protein [Bacteroidia bacterium]|nr:rhodanese-like domain-containing protein [Bacteroidia bacterium]MDW8159495.1 rhodanese-like domain-containing protein [Bacteroidia bacterium]